MKSYRLQEFVAKGKEVFVGLEDSKKTWKLAIRSEKMVIHQVSMEARYPVLIRYLRNKFPECTIHLIYEAGFKGFNLYDELILDGIDCVVIPPHVVTEPKVNKIKTDKRDARRLAKVLENHDFKDGCHVPDKERREDRQVSRTLIAIQKIAWRSSKIFPIGKCSFQNFLDSCPKHRRVPLVIDEPNLPTPAFPIGNPSDRPTDFRQ